MATQSNFGSPNGYWLVAFLVLASFMMSTTYAYAPRPISFPPSRYSLMSRRCASLILPLPAPNSIGNFFEDKPLETATFIQCYMLATAKINGTNYGVGFPMDMPVMLTYFENAELKPVNPDYPEYEHLLNHVTVQLESNDLQLYKTPVVLTLQGDFEDDSFNNLYGSADDDEEQYDDYDDDDAEEEELPLEELLAMDMDDDEDADMDDEYNNEDDDTEDEEVESNIDDDDDEDGEGDGDNADFSSFLNTSPIKIAGSANRPDFTLVTSAQSSDPSSDLTLAEGAIVSEEDTKSLRRAHRRADYIIERAIDMKLIASFHHRKKNYHLVRLLEVTRGILLISVLLIFYVLCFLQPIFIIGKRIESIKGYYFSLLNSEESEKVSLWIQLHLH